MSQADERIVMQDAYGTVEVPAAPKQKSIKRIVASAAAVSLIAKSRWRRGLAAKG